MSKKLFFLLGLLTGAVLIEMFYRPLKARLKLADAAEAERQEFNAFLRKDREAFFEQLSPEKKMEYTVRMADWGDEEEDADETGE
jgi:hypothetical protein